MIPEPSHVKHPANVVISSIYSITETIIIAIYSMKRAAISMHQSPRGTAIESTTIIPVDMQSLWSQSLFPLLSVIVHRTSPLEQESLKTELTHTPRPARFVCSQISHGGFD